MPQTQPTASVSTAPGVSRLVLVADERFRRYSEADVIAMSDGRLLLALARKEGASDFAKGTLIGLFSRDGGITWDDETELHGNPTIDSEQYLARTS